VVAQVGIQAKLDLMVVPVAAEDVIIAIAAVHQLKIHILVQPHTATQAVEQLAPEMILDLRVVVVGVRRLDLYALVQPRAVLV
jgi:hypothetical protein